MILHPLFHWSPTTRRERIERDGLQVDSEPVCHSARFAVVCVSQSPSQAWALSAGVFGRPGQRWDCWQVTLDGEDELEVVPFQGNRIAELRVRNDIPVSRLWRVGARRVSTAPGGL